MRRRQHTSPPPSRDWNWPKIAVTLLLCVGAVLLLWWVVAGRGDEPPVAQPVDTASETRVAFPTIATSSLSDTQRQVLSLARQEYQKNPTGYDNTVMTYTEGFEESWCADFISWIFDQADTPFVHPDTGYWRIPGVQTLMAYYQQQGAYHTIGDGYVPQLGDVAFYFGETPDGDSSEHVAMILEVRGDQLVTIGGNEGDDGIVQIRYDKWTAGSKGLVAIGASGIGRAGS